jgi:phage-related tail fiber protein
MYGLTLRFARVAGAAALAIGLAAVAEISLATAARAADSSFTVVNRADLALTLTVPRTAADGAVVKETVTVTNLGPDTALSVGTALPEPAGLTVICADGASVHGPALVWETPALAPAGVVTFTVIVRVGDHVNATVDVAAATAPAVTPDPRLTNNAVASLIRLG